MRRISIYYLISVIIFAAPHILFGQAGNALYFQNSNYMSHGDFVYCGAPNYGFADQFTITAWVKWTIDPGSFSTTPTNHENEGQYSTYIAYGSHNSNDINSDNIQFSLRNAKTGNKFEFVLQTSNGSVTATSTVGPSNNTWYFLTGVYDGSNIKFYVNGALTKTVAQTGTINTNAAHRLNMGKLPWGYGFFVGHLDEVRIWKRALNQSEIQSQMISATTVNSTNLASYWNFNSSTGTAIDDAGPQNADGIFYSAAIDVHGYSASLPYTVSDNDKTWTVDYWAGGTLKTVSGAGIDETNTVISNTSNTLTVNAFITTPQLDSKDTPNDTWFGVEKSGETSQWVASDAPLPVELISFNATLNETSVTLNWETATEVNNYGFNAERRVFSGEWTKLGFVQGHGNSNSPKIYSFIDANPAAGIVQYRLKQIDFDGKFEYSNVVDVKIETPSEFKLAQNFPNPFNPETEIKWQISVGSYVSLKVYNVLGKEVASLVDEYRPAGNYSSQFTSSRAGSKINSPSGSFRDQFPSGIYFYKLTAGNFTQTKKMLLMK